MISREHAAKIAKAEAISKSLGTDVSEVLALKELKSRPPSLYGVDLTGCWIAYIHSGRPPGLYSSTIVAVEQSTGQILYAGSANDEG